MDSVHLHIHLQATHIYTMVGAEAATKVKIPTDSLVKHTGTCNILFCLRNPLMKDNDYEH